MMISKHMKAVGIEDWGDITRSNLYELRDEVERELAPNSRRNFGAVLASFLRRYRDEVTLPDGWEDIIRFRGNKPVHAYLTKEELERLEAVETRTDKERLVKIQSLIEAYTGARISDIQDLTWANIKDGRLTYTSKKTKTTATIPVSGKVAGWVRYSCDYHRNTPSIAGRELIIKRLCRRAGINDRVKVVKGGKTKECEKWEAISSHDMRRSFVTNLIKAGVSLSDTGRMAGHGSNLAMTQRYICDYEVSSLPPAALDYLQG
jgi:integrase